MSHAIDDLKHEHDAILPASKILDSVARYVSTEAAVEAPEARGAVDDLLREHADRRAWTQELEAGVGPVLNGTRLSRAARGYGEFLRAQFQKEDDVHFPMAERMSSAARPDKLFGASKAHQKPDHRRRAPRRTERSRRDRETQASAFASPNPLSTRNLMLADPGELMLRHLLTRQSIGPLRADLS